MMKTNRMVVVLTFVASLLLTTSGRAETARELILDVMKQHHEKRPPFARELAGKIGANGDRRELTNLLLDETPDVRYGAAEVLGFYSKLTEAEIKALVKLLDDGAYNSQAFFVWYSAAQALGRADPVLLDALQPGLKSKNPVRVRATIVAIHFYGEKGAPVAKDVAPILNNKNIELRRAALAYFRGVGDAGAPFQKEILPLLQDPDFHTQYWAARALGAMGEKGVGAVPALIERLEKGVTSVRRNAALALGQIGPKSGKPAVAALTKALSDGRVTVREAAAEALAHFGELGRPAGDELHKMLKSHSTETRIAAVRTLARLDMHVEDCLASMISELSNDQHPWAAAEAIGLFGSKAKSAVPALIKALDSALDAETRVAAAKALGEIGDERCVQPLKKSAQEDKDAWVRKSSVEVLQKLMPPATGNAKPQATEKPKGEKDKKESSTQQEKETK